MGMNQDLIPMGDHRFFWRPAINMGGVRALVQGSTSRKNWAIFSAKISLVISDAKNGIIWEQQ
jgi:hypothetical protein